MLKIIDSSSILHNSIVEVFTVLVSLQKLIDIPTVERGSLKTHMLACRVGLEWNALLTLENNRESRHGKIKLITALLHTFFHATKHQAALVNLDSLMMQ